MKTIKNILVAITMLLSFTSCEAQIKNAKTANVKVYGNCGMCEKTIKKAGSLSKVASVDWDKNTKMATLTYDAKKTNQDEILKRIALAGYDSDAFLAPDDVYNNLPGCCQYDRKAKTEIKTEEIIVNHEGHADMVNHETLKIDPLTAVFANYFEVKDALVKTDGSTASSKAKVLLESINSVKMDELDMDVHMVWMKVMKTLKNDATTISASKDIKIQRASFDTLSETIYKLMKVIKQNVPVYYQHCSMANDGNGANWLSKESTIKNPYYGSMMMSCGKTVETIK